MLKLVAVGQFWTECDVKGCINSATHEYATRRIDDPVSKENINVAPVRVCETCSLEIENDIEAQAQLVEESQHDAST